MIHIHYARLMGRMHLDFNTKSFLVSFKRHCINDNIRANLIHELVHLETKRYHMI